MSELQNKLNLILNEKNTKIVPGNIKAGVNIFNITGNLISASNTNMPVLTLPILNITSNMSSDLGYDFNIGSYYKFPIIPVASKTAQNKYRTLYNY